jgi:hypothetical protein
VPAVPTVIVDVVSAVDHNKLVPVAVKSDAPQLSTTVTEGAEGIAIGLATPVPGAEVHPATVCVTV